MKTNIWTTLVVTALITALAASDLRAQEVPPTPTLWSFLGIPQGMRKVGGTLVNRRGNLPGLEKGPPLKGIAAPENLKSDNPLLKRAAQVKQAEDLAPQKIKAVKYLAKIGCGCYNKDGSITEALKAGMGDCTEDVRLATVEAIADAAESEYCESCKQRSCCNEELTKMLADLAYEKDETGCWLEPSEKVREAAREALQVCCPGRQPVGGPTPVPEGEGVRPEGEPPMPPRNALKPEVNSKLVSTRRNAHLHQPVKTTRFVGDTQERFPQFEPPAPMPLDGDLAALPTSSSSAEAAQRRTVLLLDPTNDRAHVQFPSPHELVPVGTRLHVYQRTAEGLDLIGQLEVTRATPGAADVSPVDGMKLSRIGRGAVVVRQ